MLDRFLDWLAALPSVAQYVVLMLLSALENVFPPVPADVAVTLGAFLSQRADTSAWLIGFFCWLANTVSAAGMYYLGRIHGESLLERSWVRRLMPPPTVQAVRRMYQRHGIFGIFVSRFLPGFRAAVTPLAGVAGMPPLRALLPAFLASGIWYVMLVAGGTLLGLEWESLKALLRRTNNGLGFVSLVLLVALLVWLARRRRPRPPHSRP